MANLLPSAERIAVFRERYWRFAGALSTIVFFVALIGAVLLVPAFVVARASHEAGADRLETTRKLIELQRDGGALNTLSNTKEKISIVLAPEIERPSDTLEELLALVPSGISIDHIAWRTEGEAILVDVSGSADTRANLLRFGDTIRASGHFGDVVIPVGSLAQQTNVGFRLSLRTPIATP